MNEDWERESLLNTTMVSTFSDGITIQSILDAIVDLKELDLGPQVALVHPEAFGLLAKELSINGLSTYTPSPSPFVPSSLFGLQLYADPSLKSGEALIFPSRQLSRDNNDKIIEAIRAGMTLDQLGQFVTLERDPEDPFWTITEIRKGASGQWKALDEDGNLVMLLTVTGASEMLKLLKLR